MNIYTYWDNEKLPELIENCINTWKKYSNYNIIILNKNNFKNYVDINDYEKLNDTQKTNAKFSDYLRFDLLSKYGGIWMDASVILTKKLNWIEKFGTNIFFYNSRNENRGEICLESWFISSKKDNQLIKKIRNELFAIKNIQEENDYIENIKNNIIIPKYLNNNYHIVYLIMSKIIQNDKKLLNDFKLFCCNTNYGYAHLDRGYLVDPVLESFLCNKKIKLIKLNRFDRNLYIKRKSYYDYLFFNHKYNYTKESIMYELKKDQYTFIIFILMILILLFSISFCFLILFSKNSVYIF